jgi:hypothetical protein
MSEIQAFELRDRKFVMNPLSARDGSFILNQAMTKTLPFSVEARLPNLPKFLPPGRPFLTEEEFHVIQDRLLAPVTELVKVLGKEGEEAEHEKKIFVNGRLIPSIDSDLYIVQQLTECALLRTILPFFIDRPTDVSREK